VNYKLRGGSQKGGDERKGFHGGVEGLGAGRKGAQRRVKEVLLRGWIEERTAYTPKGKRGCWDWGERKENGEGQCRWNKKGRARSKWDGL